MSEEISAGVKILLERSKTNPDELREESGQWAHLREAVFNYKERGERSAWLRGLTEHEIDVLHETFNELYREVFDAWVMKTVLGTGEDYGDPIAQRVGAWQMAQGKRAAQTHGWSDPKLFQTSPSIVARLKKELGIK